MSRWGDWGAKARQLTEETDRNGATYYKQAQEMIRKYTMTQDTPTVEEIAIKICDLTGYGQALHPNDIKHYLTIYGNAHYDEGVKAERVSVLDYYKEIDDREAARTMAYRWGIMDAYYERFVK